MTAFITVDELAAYISPRAPRDLSDDVLAALAVDSACSQLRTFTGQTLDYVEDDTATFILTTPYADGLLLPEMPVVEVDEVRIDGEVSLDWRLDSGGILRTTTRRFFYAGSTVEVDYSHGFATIPAELRMLALTLAARIYQQGIARQESTGSSSVTYSVSSPLDLTSGERTIVAKYRMRRAPTVEGVPLAS